MGTIIKLMTPVMYVNAAVEVLTAGKQQRKQWRAQALRRRGLSYRAIGQQLGCSHTMARKLTVG